MCYTLTLCEVCVNVWLTINAKQQMQVCSRTSSSSYVPALPVCAIPMSHTTGLLDTGL